MKRIIYKSVLLLTSSLLMLTTALLGDTWFKNYESAIEAAEKKDWASVIQYINLALKDKPTPKYQAKTVGIRFENYYPFYYLGLAYYNIGKCKEAVDGFNKSENFGEIQNDSDLYSNLQRMLSDCDEKLKSKPQVTTTATTQPIEKDSPTVVQIRTYIATGDDFMLDRNYKAAASSYEKAKSLIEKTNEEKSSLERVKEKIETVNRAGKIQDLLKKADSQYKLNQFKAAQSALADVLKLDPENADAKRFQLLIVEKIKEEQAAKEAKTVEVKPTPRTATDIRETITDLRQALNDSEVLYRRGQLDEARAKLQAVLQFQPDNRRAENLLKEIDVVEGSNQIDAAIQHYFKGNLDACRSLLDSAIGIFDTYKDQKSRLLIALQFKAVTLIENYYLDGAGNPKILQDAETIISRIFSMNPDFSIDAEYFSPKVIVLFEKNKSGEKQK